MKNLIVKNNFCSYFIESAKIKQFDGSAEQNYYIEEDQNALNFYGTANSKASGSQN